MTELLVVVVALAAAGVSGVRWLRVAQREHYLPGSTVRFAARWWMAEGPNRLLASAAVLGLLLSVARPLPGAIGAVASAVGPFRLGIKGRTSKLAWTRRMRTLAAIAGAIALVAVVLFALVGVAATGAVLVAVAMPVVIDAALHISRPIEDRLAQEHVDKAAARLRSVDPVVVGITGSYGKTSTKGYVAHFVQPSRPVVASPASFNNRAGLSRAVNEQLVPGTEVFIAEMGTYGPGEIAALCSWVKPQIGVLTAIGPVHLERFGSEERIVEAKRELLDAAELAVVNVDDARLRALALTLAASGKPVVRCSTTDADADVAVRRSGDAYVVSAGGAEIGSLPIGSAQPTNIACAVAVARELGVPDEVIARQLATLPAAPNRLTVSKAPQGFTIIDDTFNSNPAGAAAALALLTRVAPAGHRVLVTPGMIELGSRQHDANVAFAAAAAKEVDRIVIVGHTNRRSLLEGVGRGAADVIAVETREQAVAWVREHVGPEDAVLYENDLPDHYP